MKMAKRYTLMILLASTTALAASGCGVRQFNDRFLLNKKKGPALVQNYGPFWAAGQQGDVGMTTSSCGSVSGRPCARGRFSAGLPGQMDSSTNNTQGNIAAGNTFGAPAPYTTTAGPGRALSTSGPNAPNLPRVEQRDMHLMRKGAAPGEHVF